MSTIQSKSSWFLMPLTRTAVSAVMFLGASGIIANLYRLKLENPERSDPTLGYLVLGFFALIGLFGLMRGGTKVDQENECLIRWHGPLVPIWKRRIQFSDIRRIVVASGMRPAQTGGQPPIPIQAARARDWTFHVAVYHGDTHTVVRWTPDVGNAIQCAQVIAEATGIQVEKIITV